MSLSGFPLSLLSSSPVAKKILTKKEHRVELGDGDFHIFVGTRPVPVTLLKLVEVRHRDILKGTTEHIHHRFSIYKADILMCALLKITKRTLKKIQ